MIRNAVIIGSGNLAEALAHALSQAGLLGQLYARNALRAAEIGAATRTPWTDDPGRIAAADIYLIAVSDRAVREVAESLALPPGSVVAHTAGSVPLDAIPAEKYPRRAVIYPLQTFTKGRRVDFGQIPLFVEGEGEGVAAEVGEFAARVGGRVCEADSGQRRLVHLAGVFSNNFSNALYGIGERIVRRAGLPPDVLGPLVLETAAKAAAAASAVDVQTGPAVRGDIEVLRRHMELLAGDERLQRIYELISEQIWEISKKTL